MGRKMGADFSGVRFHTGKAAEAKASAVDARAYTSGNDVYFGEGGFDPAIAAHELVHTAQQGMVAAATPTVATPVGGVQRVSIRRKPHLKNKKKSPSYWFDKDYKALRRQIKAFEATGQNPFARMDNEEMLINMGRDYLKNHSNKHKGRRAEVEKMLSQLTPQAFFDEMDYTPPSEGIAYSSDGQENVDGWTATRLKELYGQIMEGNSNAKTEFIELKTNTRRKDYE